MDKGVRKILGANDRLTCGKKRTSPLDPILTKLVGGVGGREGNKPRKERERERIFRERDSNFSQNFSVIGPLNSGETRSKVGPHCKSYTWVPVLWSFDKLREVGVFSYLVYFQLKSHLK